MRRQERQKPPAFLCTLRRGVLAAACLGGILPPAGATPLDALWLSAIPEHGPRSGRIELMSDQVNDTVDVFNIRDNDPRYAGTSTGDYAGQHLYGTYQLTSRWSVDGSFWRRRVNFRDDPAHFQSWHVATQYQWLEPGWKGGMSSAVRLSHWASSASTIHRSSPVTYNGTTLASFDVSDPKDNQWQGDWVVGWSLTPHSTFNAFGGLGRSRVSIGAVNATVEQGGCLYAVTMSGTRLTGSLAQRCGNIVEAKFNVAADSLGINPQAQANYTADFAQVGFNLGWYRGDWLWRGGFLVRQFRRKQVDEALQAQNVAPIKSVKVLSTELDYRFTSRWVGALRAEVTSSQLMADIPSVYNGLTASRLGQRYGLLSVGVVYVFP